MKKGGINMKGRLMGMILFLGMLTGIASAYDNLSPAQFKNKLERTKDAILLDVRTPEEYMNDGHIPNANLIPLQVFEYIFLGGKGIKDRPVFVYCRSGHRSAKASEMLERMGVKQVYNLRTGFMGWKSMGFPVEYGRK